MRIRLLVILPRCGVTCVVSPADSLRRGCGSPQAFVYPDRAPYEDAVLLRASGIHFKLRPPPTVDFAFRANNGSEVSLFALGGLIEHIAAIVDSFSDLQGPA